MKKVIVATLLSGAISVPVFASNGNDLADANEIFSMNNGQPPELAVLSIEEMKQTEGAWIPNAIGGGIGFITGNYTYLANSAFDRNVTWSWSSYARTVGTSTLVGAINPVSSIRGAATAVGSSFVSAWQFR